MKRRRRQRRRWGMWELYTGRPTSLGARPNAKGSFVYHIEFRRCRTQDDRDWWIRHLSVKGWVKPGLEDLEKAFGDLVDEGVLEE